ncbi:putative exocyst complex component Exo84 [Helianthus anomalus]
MSPRVRTRHGEFTAELAWSGSGSRSGITPAVGRTVHYPPYIKKFYLDMKFVFSFASQGRYLSRNLNRVINEIINKALASFSVTGMDPYRSVKTENWSCSSNIFEILKSLFYICIYLIFCGSVLPEDEWFGAGPVQQFWWL